MRLVIRDAVSTGLLLGLGAIYQGVAGTGAGRRGERLAPHDRPLRPLAAARPMDLVLPRRRCRLAWLQSARLAHNGDLYGWFWALFGRYIAPKQDGNS